MHKKMKFMSIILASALAFTPVMGLTANTTNAYAASTKDVLKNAPTYRDVVYGTVTNDNGEQRELKMNIFKPKGAKKATPVLVFIHGGAWMVGDYQCADNPEGDKTHSSAYDVFKSVLKNGITFVSVDYRLSGEAIFPAQIYDIKGSIRYLRAHADEYGIDPDRIAVCGNSAGGHLATELATTSDIKELEGNVGGNEDYSSKVSACVDFYGPTDMLTAAEEMDPALQSPEDAFQTHASEDSAEAKLLGFTEKGQGIYTLNNLKDANQTDSEYWSKVELAQLASPINHVTSDDPPMFIAHGGKDTTVPIKQSLRLRDALNAAGVENIFMSNSEAPHGEQGKYVNDAAISWITDKLRNN